MDHAAYVRHLGRGQIVEEEAVGEVKESAQMGKEELESGLQKARQELEWLNEDRQAFLGQTGIHIGVGHLQRARAQFERDEQRFKERIAQLGEALGRR